MYASPKTRIFTNESTKPNYAHHYPTSPTNEDGYEQEQLSNTRAFHRSSVTVPAPQSPSKYFDADNHCLSPSYDTGAEGQSVRGVSQLSSPYSLYHNDHIRRLYESYRLEIDYRENLRQQFDEDDEKTMQKYEYQDALLLDTLLRKLDPRLMSSTARHERLRSVGYIESISHIPTFENIEAYVSSSGALSNVLLPNDEQETLEAFVQLGGQQDGGGYICTDTILSVLRHFNIADDDLESLRNELDESHSGTIEYDAFREFYLSKSARGNGIKKDSDNMNSTSSGVFSERKASRMLLSLLLNGSQPLLSSKLHDDSCYIHSVRQDNNEDNNKMIETLLSESRQFDDTTVRTPSTVTQGCSDSLSLALSSTMGSPMGTISSYCLSSNRIAKVMHSHAKHIKKTLNKYSHIPGNDENTQTIESYIPHEYNTRRGHFVFSRCTSPPTKTMYDIDVPNIIKSSLAKAREHKPYNEAVPKTPNVYCNSAVYFTSCCSEMDRESLRDNFRTNSDGKVSSEMSNYKSPLVQRTASSCRNQPTGYIDSDGLRRKANRPSSGDFLQRSRNERRVVSSSHCDDSDKEEDHTLTRLNTNSHLNRTNRPGSARKLQDTITLASSRISYPNDKEELWRHSHKREEPLLKVEQGDFDKRIISKNKKMTQLKSNIMKSNGGSLDNSEIVALSTAISDALSLSVNDITNETKEGSTRTAFEDPKKSFDSTSSFFHLSESSSIAKKSDVGRTRDANVIKNNNNKDGPIISKKMEPFDREVIRKVAPSMIMDPQYHPTLSHMKNDLIRSKEGNVLSHSKCFKKEIKRTTSPQHTIIRSPYASRPSSAPQRKKAPQVETSPYVTSQPFFRNIKFPFPHKGNQHELKRHSFSSSLGLSASSRPPSLNLYYQSPTSVGGLRSISSRSRSSSTTISPTSIEKTITPPEEAKLFAGRDFYE